MKFVISKSDKDNKYYFSLKAGNGEIILDGQGYSSRSSALNGISSVQKNAMDEANFERLESSNGKFYFNLKASNGQIIGSSEMYESENGRDKGIETVQRVAAEAVVDGPSGKFEIYKSDKSGEFYFRLKAANNQPVLRSEGYTKRNNCENGVESVRKNSTEYDHYERAVSKNGKHYFNLKATNGQVVGTSQMYASKSSMEKAIQAIRRIAPSAELVDTTKEKA